jgi:hypothetical protein
MKIILIFCFPIILIPAVSQTMHTDSICIGKIEGTVFDEKGKGIIPFAKIELVELQLSDSCDDMGCFKFTNLPRGYFSLRAYPRLGLFSMLYKETMVDSISSFASTKIAIRLTKIDFQKVVCEEESLRAVNDIKSGKVSFATPGCLAKIISDDIESDSIADLRVSQLNAKYGFTNNVYYESPCKKTYNAVIEEYMNKHNGHDWYERYQKEYKAIKDEQFKTRQQKAPANQQLKLTE